MLPEAAAVGFDGKGMVLEVTGKAGSVCRLRLGEDDWGAEEEVDELVGVVVSLSAALVVVVVDVDGGGGSGGGEEAGAELGMPKGVSSSFTLEEVATEPVAGRRCLRGDCTAASALFLRWGCDDRKVDEGTVRN